MGTAVSSEYKTACTYDMPVGDSTITVNDVSMGDTALMMFGTTLVMLQTPGMGIAQAGMIRRKNSLSMLMQCMSGMAIGSILWYIIGMSLTFAPTMGGVLGDPWPFFFFQDMPVGGRDNMCLSLSPNLPGPLFASFQMMFALMVPVIVTGAWAEKMTMQAFFIFMVLWPLFIYYPYTHWLWGGGWLGEEGAIDFAGGMNIHTAAGVAALVVSSVLQPRRNVQRLKMTHHNIALLVIGGTLIWSGWYSFNGCSALAGNNVAAAALLNTHISASMSGLTWVILTYRNDRCFHVTDVMNGAFAGLAGITPGSGFVQSQGALVIGCIVGCCSWWTCGFCKDKLRIDDVLDVFSLQGTPGIVGSLLVGFFAGGDPYGRFDDDEIGLFYGGNGKLLGAQALGVVVSILWSGFWTYVIMKVIQKTVGVDITLQMEDDGLDKTQIGEVGYDVAGISDEVQDDDETLAQELVQAAANGNLSMCKKILRRGADPNRGDYDKRTALHLAAAGGYLNVIKWLVEQKADVNAVDSFGGTPLEDATRSNNPACIAYFRNTHDCTLNGERFVGMLCDAACENDVNMIQKLVQAGADVNGSDYDQRTALHVAVSESNAAAVQALMMLGADVQKKDRWGNVPMDGAQSADVKSALSGEAISITIDNTSTAASKATVCPAQSDLAVSDKELLSAAASGDLKAVRNLVTKGANAGCKDYDHRSPLHVAAAAGKLGVVKYLCGLTGVSVNSLDRFKCTPLMDASKRSHAPVISFLQSVGATTVDQRYGFALCSAACAGETAVEKLEELLNQGADLATSDYDGRTALHLAASSGNSEAVKFLLSALNGNSNSVNVVDRMKHTPLDDATASNRDEIAQAIIDAGGLTYNQVTSRKAFAGWASSNAGS